MTVVEPVEPVETVVQVHIPVQMRRRMAWQQLVLFSESAEDTVIL